MAKGEHLKGRKPAKPFSAENQPSPLAKSEGWKAKNDRKLMLDKIFDQWNDSKMTPTETFDQMVDIMKSPKLKDKDKIYFSLELFKLFKDNGPKTAIQVNQNITNNNDASYDLSRLNDEQLKRFNELL